ncbi:MAG: hypothetical protein ACXWC6_13485 [Ramlibacter sp.]
MTPATELEAASALRSVALRASAEDTLARTARPLHPLVACVVVVCCAGTFAFGAARAVPVFQVLVDGAAGAALAFGALAFGESMRLRRRLDAALLLSRDRT